MEVIVKYIFIWKQKVALCPELRENQKQQMPYMAIWLYAIHFPIFRKNFKKKKKKPQKLTHIRFSTFSQHSRGPTVFPNM
jgi:hypothetical protein